MNKANFEEDAIEPGAVTLEQAVRLLEVSNIASLEASDLKALRKRAMRRWHPDRVAHSNPSAELVEEYETNFKAIDEALSVVSAFINGDLSDILRSRVDDSEVRSEPEEIVSKNAPANQTMVRDLWATVKQRAFELNEEEVVITEGISMTDALNEDLKDKVPSTSVYAMGVGFLCFLLAVLLFSFVGMFNGTAGVILLCFALIAWIAQFAGCVAYMLPMSRFWLPAPVTDAVVMIVNATLNVSKDWAYDEEGFGKFIAGVLGLFAALVHWLIAVPIYKIAGVLLQGRTIGENKIKIKYYAGYAEHYVDDLIEKDVTAMDLDELFDLSSMASRYKSVA